MELNGLTSVRVHASREAHCSECHLDQVRDDPIEQGATVETLMAAAHRSLSIAAQASARATAGPAEGHEAIRAQLIEDRAHIPGSVGERIVPAGGSSDRSPAANR